MAPPANTSALTATVIASLPATVTQNVHDAGTTYTVWYAYTAPTALVWLGAYAHGDFVHPYTPTVSVWLGPPSAPVPYLSLVSPGAPLQVPVNAAITYYFKVEPSAGNPSPALLTLEVERGPDYTAPAGSIVINDDSSGFPLVLIDPATGAVVQAVHPFPAGEAGDILPSGAVAVADMYNARVAVYRPDLTLVGTQPWPGAGELFGFIRAHAPSETWFLADRGTGQVRRIDTTATFVGPIWTPVPAGLTALAANHAATILYYAEGSRTAVYKWNLAANAAAGTLAAVPASFQAVDLLVLGDDTVLANYADRLSAGCRVVHYSAAGATLHTYNFVEPDLTSPAGTPARIATALSDTASFWIWTHHEGGLSRFREIRISDGTTLTTVTTTEFEGGVSQPDGTASSTRFGHSFSCPFWIARVARPGTGGAPPGGGGGGGGTTTPPYVAPGYHLEARYIRRLRRAPHVTQENTRVVYRRFELDLERGQGLASGQGADPVVLLRLSRDGGQTWGEESRMSAGALGAYTQRALARRLGHGRDTVFEVVVSDPIAWSLVGAWLELEPGAH